MNPSGFNFIDIPSKIKSVDAFLYIFIGGRGVGKTYSTLKNVYETKTKFFYLRRTQTEIDNSCNDDGNPFKKINSDLNYNVKLKKSKDIVRIFDEEGVVGYASSLSTFGNLRGADYSDVDIIIFDEFISTSSRKTLKNEFNLLMNAIETINRNRELMGGESIKVVLLSNSNTIDDDIIRALKLGDILMNLSKVGSGIHVDENRGLYMELIESDKNFKDMKNKTRLYKLTQGTSFHEMALKNEFTTDYFDDTKRMDFKELTPLFSFNKIYFYKHKSKSLIYISPRKSQGPKYSEQTLDLFKKTYGSLLNNFLERGLIFYSDYNTKLDFLHIFE